MRITISWKITLHTLGTYLILFYHTDFYLAIELFNAKYLIRIIWLYDYLKDRMHLSRNK